MTTMTKVLTPVAFVALFALGAVPASAGQHRGGGGHSAGPSRGAVSRSAGPARSYSGGYRGGVGVRGGVAVRGGGVIRGGSFYRPSYSRPYFSRPYFSRPYYSFRPRVSLGFGLWMGYPVAYPYYYDNPYGYATAYPPAEPYAYEAAPYGGSGYPPAYESSGQGDPQGYPQQQSAPSVGVQRGGQAAMGGISFEITPDSATVLVDGTYMGTAGQFGPSAEPLGLNTGRHHVEVRAAGYRTVSFDADVQAGQVLPYQGTLQRN
jgi:hypothetical protein